MSVSSARGFAGEFKEFILRGNVVDLAVGIVIGAAFTAVVTAFVKDLITPIIAAIGGKPDFSSISFQINNSNFLIGDFINAIVSFLIIAFVVFLFVVKPINALMKARRPNVVEGPSTRDCPFCLSAIPLAATRCAYCTSEVTTSVRA